MTDMPTKKSLREEMRSKLLSQSPEERAAKSRLIRGKLFKEALFKKAACVCFYVSLPTEVDTSAIIDDALVMGKRVVVPLSDLENKEVKLYQIKDRSDLREGAWRVLEPIPEKTRAVAAEEVDCVIVPGIAFDKRNNRLGRGRGFYDRFLQAFGAETPKIGLAFSFQVVQEVPHESHDVPLDLILTD